MSGVCAFGEGCGRMSLRSTELARTCVLSLAGGAWDHTER